MGMQRLILRSFSLRSGYSHDSNDRFITKSGALVLSNESNVVVYQEYDKPAIEDGWFILHTHTEIWVYIYINISTVQLYPIHSKQKQKPTPSFVFTFLF